MFRFSLENLVHHASGGLQFRVVDKRRRRRSLSHERSKVSAEQNKLVRLAVDSFDSKKRIAFSCSRSRVTPTAFDAFPVVEATRAMPHGKKR